SMTGWEGYWRKRLDLMREQSKSGFGRAFTMATIYARLADKDQAFEWLQNAYEEHDGTLILLKTGHPYLDGLRSDPRFEDMLRRGGQASGESTGDEADWPQQVSPPRSGPLTSHGAALRQTSRAEHVMSWINRHGRTAALALAALLVAAASIAYFITRGNYKA